MREERETVIQNKEGMHFRPIMRIVDTVNRYSSNVTLEVDDRKADGRNPMELLMLVGTQGKKLRLVAEGDDAASVLDELTRLIASGFSENEQSGA